MIVFRDCFTCAEQRYSLGIADDAAQHYLSIPVTARVFDYTEYYRITADTFETFLVQPEAAAAFAESCRRREHDNLLIEQPGWNRGIPS